MLHPATSVPFISNRSLNLAAFELADATETTRLARVKVPTVIPRLIGNSPAARPARLRIARRRDGKQPRDALFPGVPYFGCPGFRVVRDADIEIRELKPADLITTIEETRSGCDDLVIPSSCNARQGCPTM